MTVSEQAETASLNAPNATPQRGWLKRGLPPEQLARTLAVSQPKTAQDFNSLAAVWQRSVRKRQPSNYHKPLNIKEGYALLGFARSLGHQAQEVIEFAIANWEKFVPAAEKKYGLFGPQPAEPTIRFFVKYHDCAVNLLAQSIALKNQQEARQHAIQTEVKQAATVQPIAPAAHVDQKHRPATREECLAIEHDLREKCAVWDQQLAKGEISTQEFKSKLAEWSGA